MRQPSPLLKFIDVFWIRNVSFFIFLVSVVAIAAGIDNDDSQLNFWQGLFDLLFSYAVCLVHNVFILPIAIRQRKLIYYLAAFVFYLIIVGLLANATIRASKPEDFVANILSALVTICAGTGTYLAYKWFTESAFESKRQLWKAQEELRFLREQTNPHFLLNALNSLYAVALTKPVLVTDKIAELSFLLRYQLEATQKPTLFASEEINFIKAYINYQQSKTHALAIDFQVQGIADQVLLPPLLFFPLIENALKYSVETTRPHIRIVWNFSAERIDMMIENNFLKEGSKIQGTKFGQDNLLLRLRAHKIKYDFQTEVNLEWYRVSLNLWRESINV